MVGMKISILQRKKQRLKGLKHLLEVAQVMNERAGIQTQVICSAKALAASVQGKPAGGMWLILAAFSKAPSEDLCLKNPA